MLEALRPARQLANSHAAVLIRGELGTGKRSAAAFIHSLSSRANQPITRVCCTSTTDIALDSHLFGSASGPGLVESARGGTLLLEAIGQLPPTLHAKLQRLIRDREFERTDDITARLADVRIVATFCINSSPQPAPQRTDAPFAFDFIPIDLPPLRDRAEDVAHLARRYLMHHSRELQRTITGFSADAAYVLQRHRWPGNLRELWNVIERAALECNGNQVELNHLPGNLLRETCPHAIGDLVPLHVIEDLHIRKVVESTRTLASAAGILDVHSGTIIRRMKRVGRTPESGGVAP